MPSETGIHAARRVPVVAVRLAVIAVGVGLATALTNPFLPLFIILQLKASPSGLAMFILLSAAAALVLCSVLGHFSDRRPVRWKFLISAAACGCAGYALFAVLNNYWALLLVSMSLIAVASSVIPQMFACAREALEQSGFQRSPLGVAALRMLFSVSWVAGPPLGGLLVQLSGYAGLFTAVAGAYGVAIMAAAPSLGSRTRLVQLPSSEGRADARGSQVALAACAFVALQTANAVCVLALPLLLTGSFGVGSQSVGLVCGLTAGLEIPFMLGLGVLAARVPQRRLVLTGSLFGAAYCAAVAASDAIWQVVAAQLLAAVFVAATMAVGISFFQELAPGRAGFSTSLYSNTSKVSSMVAGPLVGLAHQFGYRSAFLGGAFLCVAGAAFLAVIRK